MSDAADFYKRVYQQDQYSNDDTAEKHPFAPTLRRFLDKHRLAAAKCVEIGSGRGAFQDLVADYTGVDYSPSVARYYRKPFHNASCEALPFADDTFDVAWSYAVLEHVGDPEKALREIRRVVKPGGLILLEPAWQCRPWAADGYPVRPYSDFGLWGKLVKASIPLRDSVLFRSAYIFPTRLAHLLSYLLGGRREIPFRNTRLRANFETFWMSDSDAQNSMDPFDALLFFESLGDRCENYPTLAAKFMIRTGPIEIRVCKSPAARMNRPSRIAFLWPELPQYGARLVRAAIAALGVPADVVSTRSALPIAGLEEILGQRIHWADAADAGATWDALGVPEPDVLVVGGWSTPAFNALRNRARASGAKVVMMVDNPWKGTWRQRLGSAWFRLARKRGVDAIWVPGRGGAEFARRLGFAPGRVETGLYGADPALFRSDTRLADRARRFVFVGQLIERKGLKVLAEALRGFGEGTAPEIDLFGTGPMEAELRGVRGLNVRGFLQSDSIARELGRTRFLVLPSLEDHWPLVVHEAACCGCGIVTTDGVGSRHELVTAANGWVYPRQSSAAMAQCLREADAADGKRLAAIEAESLRLAAPYSPTAWAGRLRGLLERIGA